MNARIVDPELKGLRPILAEWAALNTRMGAEWSSVKDAPWWYNERALVSLLAGAIWRCGGDAFEEFTNEKRRASDTSGGRIDLWFSFDRKEYNAEAKSCWLYGAALDRTRAIVSETMKRARADANCCIPDGRPRLALTFGVVLIKKERRKHLRHDIRTMIDLAQETGFNAGAVAWAFPALEKPPSADDYILPGIILWAQRLGRISR